jgi:DNA mismatch repair protein MutL
VVFTTLLSTIQDNLWENKIFQWNHKLPIHHHIPQKNNIKSPTPLFSDQKTDWNNDLQLFFTDHYAPATEQKNSNNTTYKVVWQIRDSYIIIQHEDGLRYIDQHALAERIAFEKLRKNVDSWHYESTTLLSPISIQIPAHQDSTHISEILNTLKFETSVRWDHSLIIYKVPQFLVEYHIDIEKIMRHLIDTNNQELDIKNSWINKILDSIFATRACKTSIKANHHLSLLEMQQLINDGFEHIPWSFVCQHGRPFAIEIDKKQIDTMFDR